jgi:Flp pilus assembly protein TadG
MTVEHDRYRSAHALGRGAAAGSACLKNRLTQVITSKRSGEDEGAVTIFVVIVASALLVFAGLVVDGAGKIRALQRADHVALEAARAGAQQIDIPNAARGQNARIVPTQARTAANAYLSAAGMSGTVTFTDSNQRVVVTTQETYDPVVLGIVGMGQQTMEGRAAVDLIHR